MNDDKATAQTLIRWMFTSLREVGWAPSAVFTFHIIAVVVWDIYSRIPDFDIPMHFAGGVAIAYFFGGCYRTARQFDLLGTPSKAVYPVTILGQTCVAAVLWEFAEFLMDRRFGTHSQPSLEDTLLDLFMGMLGGIVFLALQYKRWP